jgi:hypothetical protein
MSGRIPEGYGAIMGCSQDGTILDQRGTHWDLTLPARSSRLLEGDLHPGRMSIKGCLVVRRHRIPQVRVVRV